MSKKISETGVVSWTTFDTLYEKQVDFFRKVRFTIQAVYGRRESALALEIISDLLNNNEAELKDVRATGLAEREEAGRSRRLVLPLGSETTKGSSAKDSVEQAPSDTDVNSNHARIRNEFFTSQLEEMIHECRTQECDPLDLVPYLYEEWGKTRSSLKAWRAAALVLFLVLIGTVSGTGLWLSKMNEKPSVTRSQTEYIVPKGKTPPYGMQQTDTIEEYSQLIQKHLNELSEPEIRE